MKLNEQHIVAELAILAFRHELANGYAILSDANERDLFRRRLIAKYERKMELLCLGSAHRPDFGSEP